MQWVVLACVQAKQLCTTPRARKIAVAFTLVSLLVEVINPLLQELADVQLFFTYNSVAMILFYAVVPVAILVINVVVVREVHRASNSAAGLHHRSTSSNSSVPTALLATTSLVYALIYGTWSTLLLIYRFSGSLEQFAIVAFAATRLVFAYNFFVYLATGRQFREELRRLFCGLRSVAAVVVDADDGVARRRQTAV